MSRVRSRDWEENNGEGARRKFVLWLIVLGKLRIGPWVLPCWVMCFLRASACLRAPSFPVGLGQ